MTYRRVAWLVALVAVVVPVILARPDCTPIPISATSTTTIDNALLMYTARSRACLRRASIAAGSRAPPG